LFNRDLALWKRLDLGWGLLIVLAICSPWFVAVSRANPEFFDFFFIHEHFTRFLTTEHRRAGGWWYFLPVFALGILPWLTIVIWPAPGQLTHTGTPLEP